MANQNYTMSATLFKKLFPETKISSTYTGDIEFKDDATVHISSGAIFDFSKRDTKISTLEIDFPNLTTIEDSSYPNKYYWDGKSFQYNLIGTTPDGNSGGHDFLISCDFDIDPNCFFIWKDDPDNTGGMIKSSLTVTKVESSLTVTKVDILDVDSGIYKIHISTPENSSEVLALENFKNQVCIEKVRVPFKNTFVCSGLVLDDQLFKNEETKISYIANPYNEMAFAYRQNIATETKSGQLGTIKDGQKYYIPDKYRNTERRNYRSFRRKRGRKNHTDEVHFRFFKLFGKHPC